jgi:hypothetical protein
MTNHEILKFRPGNGSLQRNRIINTRWNKTPKIRRIMYRSKHGEMMWFLLWEDIFFSVKENIKLKLNNKS